MKKRMALLLPLAVIMVFAACGGSSGGGGVNISTIDQLPKATGPVVDSATGNIATPPKSIGLAKATNGLKLDDFSSSSFDVNDSMGMCQGENQLKNLTTASAQGDMILCFVQTIFKNYSQEGLDIYDGQYHYFNLDFTNLPPGQNPPDTIKMKIVKTGGNITEFEMFGCKSGAQTEYIHQTITGTTFAMNDKNVEETGSRAFTVNGVLNTNGQFTTKNITMTNKWSNGTENTGGQHADYQQFSTYFLFDGFDRSSNSSTGSINVNRVYAEGQLIDFNTSTSIYDIGLLAMGDGAAHSVNTYTVAATEYWNNCPDPSDLPNCGDTAGWNGDTLGDDDTTISETYRTAVSGEMPQEAFEISAQVFDPAGTDYYSCEPPLGATVYTITDDFTTITDQCSNYMLSNDWVNCWEDVDYPKQQLQGAYDVSDNGGAGCIDGMVTANYLSYHSSWPNYQITIKSSPSAYIDLEIGFDGTNYSCTSTITNDGTTIDADSCTLVDVLTLPHFNITFTDPFDQTCAITLAKSAI